MPYTRMYKLAVQPRSRFRSPCAPGEPPRQGDSDLHSAAAPLRLTPALLLRSAALRRGVVPCGRTECFGGIEAVGNRAGKRFSPAKKQSIVGNRRWEALPLPKRGSPVRNKWNKGAGAIRFHAEDCSVGTVDFALRDGSGTPPGRAGLGGLRITGARSWRYRLGDAQRLALGITWVRGEADARTLKIRGTSCHPVGNQERSLAQRKMPLRSTPTLKRKQRPAPEPWMLPLGRSSNQHSATYSFPRENPDVAGHPLTLGFIPQTPPRAVP